MYHHFLKKIGVDLPIIQAPMAGVQDNKLTIAVCQAGGLGSLPCAMLSLEQIEQQIIEIRQKTDRPFNVNFFTHPMSIYTSKMQKHWFEVLKPYYDEFGLTQDDIVMTGVRQPIQQQHAEMIADLKIAVVSFHFGLPNENIFRIIKKSGAIILATATTIQEAKWLQSHGVDAIIAQGLEAGGHRGMFLSQDLSTQSGTFSLLPCMVKAIDVPVIAAGGIGDSITANCAFRLGADMLQVGTAFLLANESLTKDFHKKILQTSKAQHTVMTNIFSGGFARAINNRFIQEMGYIHQVAPPFPYAAFVSNPIKNKAERLGIYDFSSFWAGQNACLAKAGFAREIIANILSD